MLEQNGFHSQLGDELNSVRGASVSNTSFRNALGHGLIVAGSTNVTLTRCTLAHNTWHGLHCTKTTGLTLANLNATQNGKCGVGLASVRNFTLHGGSITLNADTGQGGLALSGDDYHDGGCQHGVVRDTVISGNGGNIVGSEAEDVAFENIVCDVFLYKGKGWAISGEGVTTRNVSCAGNHSGPSDDDDGDSLMRVADRWLLSAAALGGRTQAASEVAIPGGQSAAVVPTAAAALPRRLDPPCRIAPGEDIGGMINAASKAGVTRCVIEAGIHLLRKPIVIPANMEVAGAGIDQTLIRSQMLAPELILQLCAFSGGNCAVFTLNNISRENITIRDLTIDGGMDRDFRAHAQNHCGLGNTYVESPSHSNSLLPTAARSPTETFVRCGWNNFGILFWDYHMPKKAPGHAPTNILIDRVHIANCSMGVHALGSRNFTLQNSILEHNGNGNGYFHNAYFLRLVRTRILNTTFHASTGHGLKITQQNDTVIDGCVVTDNRWQGIWVGQESAGNFGLTITNSMVARNHMYGIQLTCTDGFLVRNVSFANQPNPAKAGLLLASKNGLVESIHFHNNWNNIVVHSSRNVSIAGLVGCKKAFEHGLCGKPSVDARSGFTLRDSDCGLLHDDECSFRESPFL